MFRRMWFLFQFIWFVQAEYKCVCSFDGARPVFRKADNNSDVIGFLATNACRQFIYPVDETWNAIVFMHQLGFIMSNTSMMQTCFSDPVDSFTTEGTKHTTSMIISTTLSTSMATPSSQSMTSTPPPSLTSSNPSITTTTHRTTTTPISTTKTGPTLTPITTTTSAATSTTAIPSTTTTPSPNTPPTTTTTATTTTHGSTTTTTATTITTRRSTTQATGTTTRTSTASANITSYVPEGHTELCPDHLKGDINIFGGYLEQYGDFCFELVNVSTQWNNAQRHCTVAGDGHLAQVRNKAEQDYLNRFLERHHEIEAVWLGLTDSKIEGQLTWISGAPVTYTNFGTDYNRHSNNTHGLNDCVIMKQGGEWTDAPCGVMIGSIGFWFGEKHTFICQYNVTSKPPNIFHIISDVFVG